MGYPFPIQGSVGTTKETWGKDQSGAYRIPNVIEAIEIENTHASQSIYISFDGGKTYRTLLFGEVWSIDTYSDRLQRGTVDEFTLWASGATTTFELMLIVSEPD